MINIRDVCITPCLTLKSIFILLNGLTQIQNVSFFVFSYQCRPNIPYDCAYDDDTYSSNLVANNFHSVSHTNTLKKCFIDNRFSIDLSVYSLGLTTVHTFVNELFIVCGHVYSPARSSLSSVAQKHDIIFTICESQYLENEYVCALRGDATSE